ncbi:PepSY domain-containing protein [Ferdinandcohnia sp. Marseille-Q9671]
MKKKVVVLGIVGALVLGGAVGVGAFTKEADISSDKAKEIAAREVKNKQIEDIDLERKNGELFYEIEFEGAHDDDADVVVNATTGEVVRVDDDDDDDDNYQATSQAKGTTVIISKEEAIAIATKDTPGTIEEIELDDDGYYEIELKYNGTEVDLKVSSNDGTILEKEIDDNDDDFDEDAI